MPQIFGKYAIDYDKFWYKPFDKRLLAVIAHDYENFDSSPYDLPLLLLQHDKEAIQIGETCCMTYINKKD